VTTRKHENARLPPEVPPRAHRRAARAPHGGRPKAKGDARHQERANEPAGPAGPRVESKGRYRLGASSPALVVSVPLWWLVAVVGARTGEARALRRNAVDQKHGKLWIDESRFEGQTLKPKSVRGKRGIDLSQHQLERLDGYLKLFPDATDDDFLFPSGHKWRRSPLCTKRLMNEVIKPTARKLGIPKVGWKMLRLWNSTVMNEEHFSDKVRQTRLGHASPMVTNEHYTVVRDSVSRRAAEAIDRRLEEPLKNSSKNVGTNVGTAEEVGVQAAENNGRRGGTRTPDPRIRNPMLYPLSYTPALTDDIIQQRGVSNIGEPSSGDFGF